MIMFPSFSHQPITDNCNAERYCAQHPQNDLQSCEVTMKGIAAATPAEGTGSAHHHIPLKCSLREIPVVWGVAVRGGSIVGLFAGENC